MNYQQTITMDSFNCPIIHHKKIAREVFADIKQNNTETYIRPANLAIVTQHTYKDKSIFEESLEHFGIVDYVCLHHPEVTDFNHKFKDIWLLSYLKSPQCKEDIILYCDANDCVLIDDPQRVLDIFKDYHCKMLFSSTKHKKGYPTRKCRSFAKKHNKSSNKKLRHLNAGVFIGEKEFMIQVLEDLTKIFKEIDENTHPITKAIVQYYCKESDSCPPSTYDKIYIPDQNVFRYLYPKYYPDMKIDLDNRLAFRNITK